MSWDCYLTDKDSGDVLKVDEPHTLTGGTYQVGGSNELWLNITYNYGRLYRAVLGSDGLNGLNGKTGAESIPWLESGIAKLGDEYSEDYWEATEGNVKAALQDLVALAKMAPNGVWRLS